MRDPCFYYRNGIKMTRQKKPNKRLNIFTPLEEAHRRIKALEWSLRDSVDFGFNVLANSADPMVIMTPDKTVLYINPAMEHFTGFTLKEVAGIKPPYPWWPKETLKASYGVIKRGTGRGIERVEHMFQTKNGEKAWVEITSRPVKRNGIAKYFVVSLVDVTRRKTSEEALVDYRAQVDKQRQAIQDKDIALREVMAQIEEGKDRMQREILANVDNLIVPLVKKLKLKGVSQKYLDLIEANLRDLTSSFGSNINNYKFNLTRREIEICDAIRNGLASKEIAEFLNISRQTVEKHRTNIRKKLSILNADVNLATFLNRV